MGITKTEHLLELYYVQMRDDIPKMLENLSLITNSLFTLTQHLFDDKVDIKYHDKELEGKFFRFGLANQSLINLIKGNKFKLINFDTEIADVFSVNAIARMQIESFMMMYYLFFINVDDEERDFQYNIYRLHGLQKQLSLKFISKEDELIKQREKIISEISEVEIRIKNSTLFKNSDLKQQNIYLKPTHARLIKTEKLFESTQINNIGIDKIWNIYSNHAHSEHIGDRQYNSIYVIDKSVNKSCSLVIKICNILTSKLIFNFIEKYDSIKEKYNTLSEKEKAHIEVWKGLTNNKLQQNK